MRAIIVAGLALLAAACASGPREPAGPWKVTRLVAPSAFHGVHGIRLSPTGELYAGSVAGQSLYRIDPATGAVTLIEGPPKGMSDDIAFGPGGQVVWTAISDGIVYSRRGNGPVEVLARNLASINSIAFSRDGRRLFAAQVFGGDDLWELDPAGQKPPRKILAGMGGFNSFQMGPDGWLYGPLWFKGQVVRINPDTGELAVVARGVGIPASVKFDSRDNLYVIDTATGQLLRVDRTTGDHSLVAQLQPSLDNFTIGPDDKAFVTNMADNGVQEVDLRTGRVRQVIKGALAFPAEIDVGTLDGREMVYVADVFAYRMVDAATGDVRDLDRAHQAGSHLDYPVAVHVGPRHVVLTGFGGSVMLYDRATGGFVRALTGFTLPADALEMTDGAILVLERTGRLIRVSGLDRKVVAEGLAVPSGFALAGNAVFVAEPGAGRVTRVDLATGAKSVAASGLAMPKAVAVAPDGALLVLEIGAKQVSRFDARGTRSVIAANLPLGLVTQPVPLAGGLAVSPTGAVYVSSDVENSIYRIAR